MHNGLAGKHTTVDKDGGEGGRWGNRGRGTEWWRIERKGGGEGGGDGERRDGEEAETDQGEAKRKVIFPLRLLDTLTFSLLSECLFTCSHFGF